MEQENQHPIEETHKKHKKCHDKTECEMVREFNIAAEQDAPDFPKPMSKDAVLFLIRMVLDEMMELGVTVAPIGVIKAAMKEFIDTSKDLPQMVYDYPKKDEHIDMNVVHQCADQVDAIVDAHYDSLNEHILAELVFLYFLLFSMNHP